LIFRSIDINNVEIFKRNAIVTLVNIFVLSLLFCIFDSIRRTQTVTKPVIKIKKSLQKMTKGDFNERIKPIPSPLGLNQFNLIIEDINILAEELSGVETLRTDFISNVSHELKTPLAVIRNYTTLLKSPNITDEKREEYIEAISNTSKKLADLITNILKLNKLENQQIYPEFKSYNLSEQLCECLLNFENQWEEKNIEIDTLIDDDVFVNSDSELMSIVWNNLISNAIKFTDNGGKVSVSLKKQNGYINVAVSDTGCGISQQTGKHIFEKFYQGDTSHKAQGNGLGLALVKRIVDITGSDISVESVECSGTTFVVRIKNETN
jgi:signal transduction histidine kinase